MKDPRSLTDADWDAVLDRTEGGSDPATPDDWELVEFLDALWDASGPQQHAVFAIAERSKPGLYPPAWRAAAIRQRRAYADSLSSR